MKQRTRLCIDSRAPSRFDASQHQSSAPLSATGSATASVNIDADVWETAKACMAIVSAIRDAGAQLAKDHPSSSGLYPVTIVTDADGNPALSGGHAVVSIPPVMVTHVGKDHVGYALTDQLLSPKDAERLTSMNRTTIWRAVHAGDLPEPTKLEGRRVAHKFGDLLKWIDGKQSA